MKNTISTLLAAALMLLMVSSLGADDKPWFDMENCAFCRHLVNEPGLMDHMQWEYHLLTDGMLSITHVEEGYEEAYVRAQKNMEKTGQEMLKTGDMPPMCGHCEAYGNLMMTGVKPQHVRSEFGDIVIWTSDDSTVVRKLHRFAKRNIEELAKLEAAEKSE
jgi:hypothetical protein